MSWQKDKKTVFYSLIIIGFVVFCEGVIVDDMFRTRISKLEETVFDLETVDIKIINRFDKKIKMHDKTIKILVNNDIHFKENIEYQLILIQSLEKIFRMHEH